MSGPKYQSTLKMPGQNLQGHAKKHAGQIFMSNLSSKGSVAIADNDEEEALASLKQTLAAKVRKTESQRKGKGKEDPKQVDTSSQVRQAIDVDKEAEDAALNLEFVKQCQRIIELEKHFTGPEHEAETDAMRNEIKLINQLTEGLSLSNWNLEEKTEEFGSLKKLLAVLTAAQMVPRGDTGTGLNTLEAQPSNVVAVGGNAIQGHASNPGSKDKSPATSQSVVPSAADIDKEAIDGALDWDNPYTPGTHHHRYADVYNVYQKHVSHLPNILEDIKRCAVAPTSIVLDTIAYLGAKSGMAFCSLEEIKPTGLGDRLWQKFVDQLGPWTESQDLDRLFACTCDAFLLQVAHLAAEIRLPLRHLYNTLMQDIDACPMSFHSPAALARGVTGMDRDQIIAERTRLLEPLLNMKMAYKNLRRGLTKFYTSTKHAFDQIEQAVKTVEDASGGGWDDMSTAERERQIQEVIKQSQDPEDIHQLNGAFDYRDKWTQVRALVFSVQYARLAKTRRDVDKCANVVDALYDFIDPRANAAAREEDRAQRSLATYQGEEIQEAPVPDPDAEDDDPGPVDLDLLAAATSEEDASIDGGQDEDKGAEEDGPIFQ